MLVVCMAVLGAENGNEDLGKLLTTWREPMIDNLKGVAWDNHFKHDYVQCARNNKTVQQYADISNFLS